MTSEQDDMDDMEPSNAGSTFTLRSIFVLMTCAGVACAILFPLLHYGRENARRMGCSNNLKQLVLGIHNYHDTVKRIPRSFHPHSQLSWTVALIPYLEATPLYNMFVQDTGPYYSVGKNDPHGLVRQFAYYCPASGVERMETSAPSNFDPMDLVPSKVGAAPFTIHYYGINGPIAERADGTQIFPLASSLSFEGAPVAGSGMFQWTTYTKFADITDGLSNTLCLGEMSWTSKFGTRYRSWVHGGTDGSYIASCRNIAQPINAHLRGPVIIPMNNMPMGSQHRGGTNFGMGDGSVQFLTQQIDFAIYQDLATRNDENLEP